MTPEKVSAYLLSQSSQAKWSTVRFALDSWKRTAQFCVMVLVMNVPRVVYVLGSFALIKWKIIP